MDEYELPPAISSYLREIYTGMQKCHCGQPLHYSSKAKAIENYINDMCAKHGDYIDVTSMATGKTYKVQRHYIALHGIKGYELDNYGFEEVKKKL